MARTVEGTPFELAVKDFTVRKCVGQGLSEVFKAYNWNPAQTCYGSPMLASVDLTGIGAFV